MTRKQTGGRRFAFATTLVAVFALLGLAAFGPASRALAQDEPDFLVLNPAGE